MQRKDILPPILCLCQSAIYSILTKVVRQDEYFNDTLLRSAEKWLLAALSVVRHRDWRLHFGLLGGGSLRMHYVFDYTTCLSAASFFISYGNHTVLLVDKHRLRDADHDLPRVSSVVLRRCMLLS